MFDSKDVPVQIICGDGAPYVADAAGNATLGKNRQMIFFPGRDEPPRRVSPEEYREAMSQRKKAATKKQSKRRERPGELQEAS